MRVHVCLPVRMSVSMHVCTFMWMCVYNFVYISIRISSLMCVYTFSVLGLSVVVTMCTRVYVRRCFCVPGSAMEQLPHLCAGSLNPSSPADVIQIYFASRFLPSSPSRVSCPFYGIRYVNAIITVAVGGTDLHVQ